MIRSSRLFGAALLFLLCACLGAREESESGTFELRVKDHRDAIGDFSSLTVRFESIRISRKPGLRTWRREWTELAADGEPVDLTRYVGDRSAMVFRGQVEAAAYDGLDLRIASLQGLAKKTGQPVAVANSFRPVEIDFEVSPGGRTVIVLDLTVLDLSDHPGRGYELALKGLEVYTNDKLTDKIPPA